MEEQSIQLPADYDKLSPTVTLALRNMSQQQRDIFEHEYQRRKRDTVLMVVLAVLFPIQFFFLNKAGLGVAYLLTGGFFLIGWIVFWFITPGMVREYNESVANDIVRNIRYASQSD